MKAFMDKDFMLQSATAQHLYHDYAAAMPICDYHCHIPPREIYENRRFENITQVWLGGRNPDGSYFGDHYKWRVMRSNGVPEEYITGDKPDRERFQKFAEALPMAIGNPMYHWTNLELHVFFGYDGVLNGDTAEEVWNLCNDKLQHDPKLTVRGLIEQSNVAFIGTTDDPIDDLYWHKKIKEDPTIKFTVAPSFRPDKAININKPGFAEYMAKLAAVVGKEKLACIDCVTDALTKRIEFFAEMGCRASDHGLDYVPYREATKDEVNAIYQKVMKGESCTVEEAEKYQTYILIHLGKQYHRLGIAMQIHYNCLRGVNRKMNSLLGPDTGFDMINTATCGGEIAQLLSALNDTDECPKTIIYSLNPADDAQIGTILGCFQNSEVPGKIQHGSAWWFNDHKIGMEDQMIRLAAERGIADRFHFPGFMKGKQVYEVLKASDVYIMPSVSEPFGISPLEAMQCSVPSIISKQSGCAEILEKCIKTDYWDIHAMADAIYSICTYPAMYEYLRDEGKKEVDEIKWENVGYKVRGIYDEVIKNYGKQ